MGWVDGAVAWLKDWQTLVAGGLAIVAALIGGGFILVQVNQSERQENKRRARAYAAARATLPLALSAVSEYALQCGRLLRELQASSASHSSTSPPVATPQFPGPPADVIADFQNLIAASEDPVASVFTRFLAALQVQAARIRNLQASLSPSPSLKVFGALAELEDRAFDAAALYARAAALFEYARGVSEAPPVDYEPGQMKVGLHLMGFYDYDQPQLYGRIDGRSNFSI